MRAPGGDAMMAFAIAGVLLAAAMRNIIPPAPSTTVGIDLGTTFSCVAIFDRGEVHVVQVEPNSTILPSAVALRAGEAPIVGRAALLAPAGYGVVYDAKRFIGRAHEPGMEAELAREVAQLPFSVVPGWSKERRRAETHILPNGMAAALGAEEVSAMVLRALRDAAERHIGRKVRSAVLAVPVDFTEAQRNATREAARLAGIEVLRLLHEPTAAAIAYGLHQRPTVTTVMVYDLGGGTLDVSLLTLDDGIFSVVAAAGNNFLGGQDVNRLLLRHFVAAGLPALSGAGAGALDDGAHASLFRSVEALKLALSEGCDCAGGCESGDDARVAVPLLLPGRPPSELSLSRAELEAAASAFLDAALLPVGQVLDELGISADQASARGGAARPGRALARQPRSTAHLLPPRPPLVSVRAGGRARAGGRLHAHPGGAQAARAAPRRQAAQLRAAARRGRRARDRDPGGRACRRQAGAGRRDRGRLHAQTSQRAPRGGGGSGGALTSSSVGGGRHSVAQHQARDRGERAAVALPSPFDCAIEMAEFPQRIAKARIALFCDYAFEDMVRAAARPCPQGASLRAALPLTVLAPALPRAARRTRRSPTRRSGSRRRARP